MKKFFCFFSAYNCYPLLQNRRLIQCILLQTPPKKDWSKLDLSTRANDHFLIQYGDDAWPNVPDSINTSGFSRHFNII